MQPLSSAQVEFFYGIYLLFSPSHPGPTILFASMHLYVQIFNGGFVFCKFGMAHPSLPLHLLPFTYTQMPLVPLAVGLLILQLGGSSCSGHSIGYR